MILVRLEQGQCGKRVVAVTEDGEVIKEYDVTSSLPDRVGVQIVAESGAKDAVIAACDRAFGHTGCQCGRRSAIECDGEECRADAPTPRSRRRPRKAGGA